MTVARWQEGRRNSVVLAENLRALASGGEDEVNADAGALALAHALNTVVNVCEALARRG